MHKKIFIALLLVLCVSTAVFADTYTVNFARGFNFLSFTNGVTLTPAQLKSANTNIDNIYKFDAQIMSFFSYNDNDPITFAPGTGYIVKTKAACAVDAPGAVLSTIGDITVYRGYNIVGFSKAPAGFTFKSLMTRYSNIISMHKWDPALNSFIAVVRNGSSIVELDGLNPVITAGEAYYMKFSEQTKINIDGTDILIGSTVDPNAKPATIEGVVDNNPPMPTGAPLYQSADLSEQFEATLVDYDGNVVPDSSLDPATPNNQKVTNKSKFSFKVKDFTKSYKVIAKSLTNTNKILSSFFGKVQSEEFASGNADPISTAYGMVFADPNATASSFKSEENRKKSDTPFMNKFKPFVTDLETKRLASLKDVANLDTPAKLERAYKDAVLGSVNTTEIGKIKENLEQIVGKIESQLTLLEKLKDALALIATNGRRQNETLAKQAKDKVKAILADPSIEQSASVSLKKDAKIALGLICGELGNIYKNKVNQTTSASGAPSLMAAYQAMSGELNSQAKAEFNEGYNAVKDIVIDETDKQNGRDKNLSAVVLKNASELAMEDPAKLDEATKKADALTSKLDDEGKSEFTLPTGETLTKDKILEKKGDALINAKRPDEAVEVFKNVSEDKVKNFGLGRAYLLLNDLESAYKNLKDTVKALVKATNSFDERINVEQTFNKINEALFAFAAILDRIKTGVETDVQAIKQKIQTEEQASTDNTEKIIDDPNVTVGGIVKNINASTNFFEVGKKYVQGGLGNQIIGQQTQPTDALLKKFNNAMNLMFKANELLERSRKLSNAIPAQVVYEGKTGSGTITAPADGTVLKYLLDAKALLAEIFASTTFTTPALKGDAHFNIAMNLLAQYRALEYAKRQDINLIAEAEKLFLEIQSLVNEDTHKHLAFAVVEQLRIVTTIKNALNGVAVTAGSALEEADKLLARAKAFAFDNDAASAVKAFSAAYVKYNAVYVSSDSKITENIREVAMYFSAYCTYYIYRFTTPVNEELRVNAIERLKLFALKFPESSFNEKVQDFMNKLNASVEIGGDDITIVKTTAAEPGKEFKRAMALVEKLRAYYKNNAADTEIAQAFDSAEAILKKVIDETVIDVIYVGTYKDAALKHFRAQAKFQLAILYMERYVLKQLNKEIAYRILALKILNELYANNLDEPFIYDVKKFIDLLEKEVKEVFEEGKLVVSEILVDPRVVTQTEALTGTKVINLTARVNIPGTVETALAGVTVKAELRRFGNAVYVKSETSNEQLSQILFTQDSAKPTLWTAKFTVPKNIEIGEYEFVVVAVKQNNKSDVKRSPFIVKGVSTAANITEIYNEKDPSTLENTLIRVKVSVKPYTGAYSSEPGKYNRVYVKVMQPYVMAQNISSSTTQLFNDSDYIPVNDMPEIRVNLDEKLTPVDAAGGAVFTLNINESLSTLKSGNYVFMFKLVNFKEEAPDASLMAPIQMKPFNFFIENKGALDAKTAIIKIHSDMLANFNDVTKTPEERVAIFEKMHNNGFDETRKTILIKMLKVLGNTSKVTAVGDPYIVFTSDEKASLFAVWKFEGTYSEDLPEGLVMPNGHVLLPKGLKGFILTNFMNKQEYDVIKLFTGAWSLTVDTGSMTGYERPDVKVTKINGVDRATGGTLITEITVTSDTVMMTIEGTNFIKNMNGKRMLRLYGPDFAFPIVLADNSSADWQDTIIKFSASKFLALRGEFKLEIFDEQFGGLEYVPIRIKGAEIVDNILAKVFKLSSYATDGVTLVKSMDAPAFFDATTPFDIERSNSLVIDGAGFTPLAAGGKYTLKVFDKTTSRFVEILSSDNNNGWLDGKITVGALSAKIPAAIVPDGSVATLRMFNALNLPVSSPFFIRIIGTGVIVNPVQKPAMMMIVNGVPVTVLATGAVTEVLIDNQAGAYEVGLKIEGYGFLKALKPRLDLMFFVDGKNIVVPISFNEANTWTDVSISAKLNLNLMTPLNMSVGAAMSKFQSALVIFDQAYNREVSNRVPLKLKNAVVSAKIPQVMGLVYDSAAKLVKWSPVVDQSGNVCKYQLMIDGIEKPDYVYETMFGTYNMPDGSHEISVRALVDYPTLEFGAWSQKFYFSTGGSIVRPPQVTGLKYDAANKVITWNPLETAYKYTIKINGLPIDKYVSESRYDVSYMVFGDHKIAVGAVNSLGLTGPWSEELAFTIANTSELTLRSESFPNNGIIPAMYTGVTGAANKSPNFSWFGGPTATQAYAIICEDITTTPATVHWVIYNIPFNYTILPTGIAKTNPVTIENYTMNQLESYMGTIGYDGPNPPLNEEHTYVFKLYALKSMLSSTVTSATFKAEAEANKLASVEYRGKFTAGAAPSGVPKPSNITYNSDSGLLVWKPMLKAENQKPYKYNVIFDTTAPVSVVTASFGLPADAWSGAHTAKVQAVDPDDPTKVSEFAAMENGQFYVYDSDKPFKYMSLPTISAFTYNAASGSLEWTPGVSPNGTGATATTKYFMIATYKTSGVVNVNDVYFLDGSLAGTSVALATVQQKATAKGATEVVLEMASANGAVYGIKSAAINMPTAQPPVTAKKFTLKGLAPVEVPAPTLANPNRMVSYDPALYTIKIVNQDNPSQVIPTTSSADAKSWAADVMLEDKPINLMVLVTRNDTGKVVYRSVVGQVPSKSQVTPSINAFEMNNIPVNNMSSSMAMLAFEKAKAGILNAPPVGAINVTSNMLELPASIPVTSGLAVIPYDPSNAEQMAGKLQKAAGGAEVVAAMESARQGIASGKDAIAKVKPMLSSLSQYSSFDPSLGQLKTSLDAQVAVIEEALVQADNALAMVPTAAVPNPLAATELVKAYKKILGAKDAMPGIMDNMYARLQTLASDPTYGTMIAPMLSQIKSQIDNGKAQIAQIPAEIKFGPAANPFFIVNKDTDPSTIAAKIASIPAIQ